jgi:hypothetical protein
VSLTGLVPVLPHSPLRVLAPSDPTVVLTPHVDDADRARLEAALRAAVTG